VNNANRGAIVAPVDKEMIKEIYEFRQAIESYVAGKVAERKDFDPTKLREIIVFGRKTVQDGLVGLLIDLDLEFHSELYRESQNRVVVDVMQTQWGPYPPRDADDTYNTKLSEASLGRAFSNPRCDCPRQSRAGAYARRGSHETRSCAPRNNGENPEQQS